MIAPILYVDDDRANLVVFEATLEGALPIRTAGSGVEALEILRSEEIAVLLTDQRMPGMSGVELAEQAKVEFPDTVRVLITAYSDLNAAVDAINRGQIHLYLRKPWEPRELRLALESARERYLTTRRMRELERRLLATERVYALGVIAAGIAHEIRGPVGVLQTNVEVLREGLRELNLAMTRGVVDPGSATMQLAEMDAILADCSEATHNVLEITRSIEVSTRSVAETEVDLREVIRLVTRSIRAELYQRGTLDLDLGEVPVVCGSRTRLGQVVLNLVVNALEAMRPERRGTNRLKVKLWAEDGRVRLLVEDNGPGIPPAALDRIFDPFFTTKADGGTGLGLAISRRIVEECAGSLEVTSVEGVGTRFVVDLPAGV
ncbi:sensor histidine kinase [Vulgatibacter sp.]|uniref:sensor histidine kinase n=1 Tax=Vulgatibacter sp. TaxID=1971226 RepID=UPI003562688E